MADNQTDEEGSTNSETSTYGDQDFGPVRALAEEELAYLQKKGAVEILAQLADGPKRFSEINDALVISHGTVATRLTEGAKIDLLNEEIHYPDEGGKQKLYELTPTRRMLADWATDHNIDETTEQRKKAKERHETALSEFQNEVEEHTHGDDNTA